MSPLTQLLLLLLILIGAARLGGAISARLGQPTVLGTLLAGIILGPSLLNVMDWSVFHAAGIHETIHSLSELGVIFLMFLAGLRTEAHELQAAGKAAAWTAVLGVVIPFGGGLAAGLIWHYPLFECIFVGLLLTATSVSISAQTLVDLGKLRTRVGTTLLGAAVLDDVLGLLLLSVTLAVHSASGVGTVLWTLTRLLGFLGGAWFGGRRVIPWLAEKSRRWNISDPEVTLALLVLMALAFGAEAIGSLAAITGAFMAGVLFSHTDLRDHIDKAIAAMTYVLLVPLFLVSIGLNTDLKALSGPVLPLALVLCGVAIATKIIGCGLGARISGMSSREALQIGAGMVSRGEVGLIIATIGLQEGIAGPEIFSLAVAVVLATTIATPLLLKWSFRFALPAFSEPEFPHPARPLPEA